MKVKKGTREFINLRDKLCKNGISLKYDTFSCKDHYFSMRLVLLDEKLYLMKRCDRVCIEIDCVDDLLEIATNNILDDNK